MIHSLDAWLWRRGIDHPAIRVLLRNEILLAASGLLIGGLAFTVTPGFSGLVGLTIMAGLFGDWRAFLRKGAGDYSTAFFANSSGALGRQACIGWRGSLCIADYLQSTCFCPGWRHGRRRSMCSG